MGPHPPITRPLPSSFLPRHHSNHHHHPIKCSVYRLQSLKTSTNLSPRVTISTSPRIATGVREHGSPSFNGSFSNVPKSHQNAKGALRGCPQRDVYSWMPSYLRDIGLLPRVDARFMSFIWHSSACFFLEWMLDSCRSFGIPQLVSHGMGMLPMAIGKATSLHSPCIRAMLDSDPINLSQVKVLFSLKRADLPNSLQKGNADDPWLQFMAEVGEADADSWGFIVNSFEELEGEYVATLESFFKKKSYAWCVGQLLLVNQIEQEATSDDQLCWYIKWLNKQLGPSGVICISFGTQAHVSNTQMDEIAMGLEMASHPFIWVVPSTKWTPPDGWEERVKERGLIAKDWVEQMSILAHPSMGGFLSRCGWNSVLESLLNGTPMLGWPMGAKQGLNAKYVADGLGAGILVDPQPQGRRRVGTEGINTIEHDVICHKVKELMSRETEESPRESTRIWDYGKTSYGERWIIPQEVGRIDRSA